MKKILYLSPQNVIPPIDGGKIGIYNPIKELAKEFDVYFAYIDSSKEDTSNLYKSINVQPIRFFKNIEDSIFLVFKNIFKKQPFKMQKYFSQDILNNLFSLVQEKKIDIVIASHSHMAYYALELKKKFNLKIILREHNIEYELVEQYYKSNSNFFKKLISFWQFHKTKRYEISLYKEFDKVIFISDTDFKAIEHFLDMKSKKHEIVYDGFITNNEKLYNSSFCEKNSFIFTGNIESFQNRTNLEYFISNIWKEYIKENSNSILYLTGSSNSSLKNNLNLDEDELKKLNIVNLGFVEDIDDTIISKQFFVSPTLIGSGIRIKVLHALSLGMPVIASKTDVDMVNYFSDMKNIIKYESYDEFNEKVVTLKNNINLISDISNSARILIQSNISWDNYRNQILKIIKDIDK